MFLEQSIVFITINFVAWNSDNFVDFYYLCLVKKFMESTVTR